MRVRTTLSLLVLFSGVGSSCPQATVDPPHPDATDHLIFNSVLALLERWPNTLYRNGHTIVPATIPPGTLLYHGSPYPALPTNREWLAFDFEHAYLFTFATDAPGAAYVTTYATSRALRVAYFDGSSAAKLDDGPMDTQDILLWGEGRPDMYRKDIERLAELCKWAREYGVDGFVRMEYHFEFMLCDFTDGLDVVSTRRLLPRDPYPLPPNGRGRPRTDTSSDAAQHAFTASSAAAREETPQEPRPIPRPEGWKGSLPSASMTYFEAIVAAARHNRAPGETRVRPDYAGLITFYDRAFESLVEVRRGVPRLRHRVANISSADASRAHAEIAQVFRRAPGGGSGVNWGSVARGVVDTYAERLDLLRFLVDPTRSMYRNVTERAGVVRAQLLTMLTAYISLEDVPSLDRDTDAGDRVWAAPIVARCAESQTAHFLLDTMTPQERRIRDAVQGTQTEICRRLGTMWLDAFDIQVWTDEDKISKALGRWRREVGELMAWLGWPEWVRCEPACGVGSMCYVATWPFWLGDDPTDLSPRCISRSDPFGMNEGSLAVVD
ncbi:hypothetical protein FA95DRAFT_159148 [Auriscalpium vulgare]|uniref:Uncharacterized protein n=1 Tax=Auriscalpium vulgare TaxID=40419 RepID=A0ACB8RLW6_9AGAM|nr:hypothetical protein FA95DRAFT_159148 [Auriscalpium vulgare]